MAVKMKDFLYKVFLKEISFGTKIAAYARYIFLALTAIGLVAVLAQGQISQQPGSAATNAICLVFNTVRNIIFLLGLTLMILGAALYAGANIMPAQAKGGFQGYGMAMIIGGVVGVAIAVAAPFVLNLILSANPGNNPFGSASVQGVSNLCPGGT